MDNKDLIDFITRLNERHLKKQTATGFSLWAISGVMAFATLKLFNTFFLIFDDTAARVVSLPFIASNLNYFYFLLLATFGFVITAVALFSPSFQISRKIPPSLQTLSQYIFSVPINVFYFIFFSINYLAALNSDSYNISYWTTMSIALFYLLVNPIPSLYKQIKKIISIKKGIILFPELETIVVRNKQDLLLFGAVTLLIATPGLVTNFLNFKSIYALLSIKQMRLLIEVSAEIVAIIVLTFILAGQIRELTKTSWLEELERDIYIKGLSEKDIRERLESGYFGSDLKTWIIKQRETFSNQVNVFLKEVIDYETRLFSLTQDELLAQKNNYQAEITRLSKVIHQFYNENGSKLKALFNKTSSTEETDESDIYLKIYVDRAAELKERFLKIKQKLSF